MLAIESPEDVAKFLHLQTLSLKELQVLSKDINKEQDSKSILIEQILNKEAPTTKSQELVAQGIPLKSKDKNGKLIPNTKKTYQEWRKLIFETKNNLKDFDFINKDGKRYSAKVFYIKCSPDTVKYMIQNSWYAPYPSQKTLVNQIKTNLNQFEYHIVRKITGNGNNFLMLHCQKKEE